LEIPANSIIYCDIPYQGTKQYSTSKDFNHSNFWNWCGDMVSKGHTIFVSEYEAPTDFECVWQKEAKSSLSANGVIGGNKVSVEKLFKFSPTNVQ
jgi:DNA adenine methylase